MAPKHLTRREFLGKGTHLALGVAGAGLAGGLLGCTGPRAAAPAPAGAVPAAPLRPVVSLARVKNGKIDAAVEEAIDLLGGIETVAKGKERILLKPNLVSDQAFACTRPQVVETLARLMKKGGKDVSVGEGSAAAGNFNASQLGIFRTKKREILEPMQQHVFDRLGYGELAERVGIPLVNLHTGDMVKMKVPGGGLAFGELQIHHALVETDLLCSVPMMKTHDLATVTLGMKNVIGLYPGQVYGTVRHEVHNHAFDQGSPGVAWEILDMFRVNKMGLVVVDGSRAMEGDGPSDGILVDMNLIVAGTNPLATDMVAAAAMGIEAHEVPTFVWAEQLGMSPTSLDEIEIRGAPLAEVRRPFVRPRLGTWDFDRQFMGAKEI